MARYVVTLEHIHKSASEVHLQRRGSPGTDAGFQPCQESDGCPSAAVGSNPISDKYFLVKYECYKRLRDGAQAAREADGLASPVVGTS
ncbi:hypothetical protein DAPPUDRAFT_262255 [Daphnia pulex]|uniref:Uncharacterized protein n=1 Tax=Daphnia pulex TaxID=6669 RepID=E9HMN5_DAPPU|nr:hypothetical protein DAPPUDRAFT_262255 [Daphnia pulex]|eukprot:EFX67000.1 hypothetical protein DAPPUDRAFT_262255 [Daphnia pulex]